MGFNGRDWGGEGDRVRMNGDSSGGRENQDIHKEQYLLSKGVHNPMKGKEEEEEKKMLLVC